MGVAEVVRDYVAAWNEPDEATRRRLIEATWAEGGTYLDPGGRVEGRAALLADIAEFRSLEPRRRVELRSGIDVVADRHFRFAFATVDDDGAVRLEGVDTGEVDDDGRIASIVAFFGPLPDLPA